MQVEDGGEGAVRRGWGTWLADFEWSHWTTLTTRRAHSPEQLAGMFRNRFVQSLASRAQRRVQWFYAIEGAASGHPHIHALIGGTVALTTDAIARCWPAGNTRILVYDPTRGAAFYVAKEITGPLDHYDLSRRFRRR